MAENSLTRRYDIDWLRVFAFAFLIPYHISLGYVSWGDIVYGFHNPETGALFLSLSLLFYKVGAYPYCFLFLESVRFMRLRNVRLLYLLKNVLCV